MIDFRRLDLRMQERKISQAELARRVGMQQSSVSDLVSGKSRTSRKIREIARELNTTPEYLEGQTDDPSESFAGNVLSDDEVEWVHLLRSAGPEAREAMLLIARRVTGAAISPTVHDRSEDYKAG